ncbi:hypothetical protein PO909_026135 [Leuciscus waleckii]
MNESLKGLEQHEGHLQNIFMEHSQVVSAHGWRAGGLVFITFGGSGGMTTRKAAPRGRKPRVGLRSTEKAASEEEEIWNSGENTEDEEGATSLPRISPKSSPQPAKSITPDATADEGMVSMMRRFLNTQEQREERYLQELRGLRESIVRSIRPAETSLDVESERMELPMPAPKVSTRHGPVYFQDSLNAAAQREPRQWADPKMPSFQEGD